MPLSREKWLATGGRAVVFNTEAAYFFLRDQDYRTHTEQSDVVYCDGIGLSLYLRMKFGHLVVRYHGPDVMHDYLSNASGRRVLILGGSHEAQLGLSARYAQFFQRNTVTLENRHFKTSDFEALSQEVVSQNFDDVLIFFGLMRQEHFQHCLHEAGYRGNSIGLGAAIDFLSGTKARSGPIWQRLGLEWLPRLLREPRMWIRVLRSAALFMSFAKSENAKMADWLFRAHRG